MEISPLTDIAENMEDNLVLIGNRTLISLNLSSKFNLSLKSSLKIDRFLTMSLKNKGNYLTEKSIEYFLLGLQYQSTLMAIHQTPGNGLLRLVINVRKFE